MTKIMFQHYDVATPKWFVVDKKENGYTLVGSKIKKFFGFPCVVKPNDQGSTVGLTICRGESEIEQSIKLALQFSDKAMIEEYIPGRELTVGILGQQTLPVLEIKPKHGLYDYEAKYTDGMSEYIVPADIPENVANHLQHQALLAYNSVNCSNYARVDFRLTNDNKNYCLEVNTLPGMTSHSLIPKMAKAVRNTQSKIVGLIYLLIFLIIVIFLFINDKGLLKYIEVKDRVKGLEKEIDSSEQRINKINAEIDSLKTDRTKIEKTAREKYNMKRPLEKGLDVKVKKNGSTK